MNQIILQRLKEANCNSLQEELAVIREMVQEIALVGLWRAKFYEKACFYGGTALRILYNLPRFSEDLDFSLLLPDEKFQIQKYETAILSELNAFGFEVTVEQKQKNIPTRIESAFIKGNTLIHLLKIQSTHRTHRDHLFKVKLEVDTDPPSGFDTFVRFVFWPIPFSIKCFAPEDLFAGKMHACLCRTQRKNVKGRDWFDFLWFVGQKTPLHLQHLTQRMNQTGHLTAAATLTPEDLRQIFIDKLAQIDFSQAKRDVAPFIKNLSDLDAWSPDLFQTAFERIEFK